jgi:ribosomal protein S17E
MKNIEIDLYTGYEGESEIVVEVTTDIFSKKVRIWRGYFSRIIKYIKPHNNTWTGLAYYYHLVIGSTEEDHWQIPDLEEALSQLKNINIPEDEQMYEVKTQVLPEIINILSKGIEEKVPVYITIC